MFPETFTVEGRLHRFDSFYMFDAVFGDTIGNQRSVKAATIILGGLRRRDIAVTGVR